jgi:hypothetical protein
MRYLSPGDISQLVRLIHRLARQSDPMVARADIPLSHPFARQMAASLVGCPSTPLAARAASELRDLALSPASS